MRIIPWVLLALFHINSFQDINAQLFVVNKDEGTVWVINLKNYNVEKKIDVGDGPHEIAVSPDGKKAVTGNYFFAGKPLNTLKVIDVASLTVENSIDLSPYYTPHGIEFLNNSREIYVTAENHKKILKVNVYSGKIENIIDTEGGLHLISIGEKEKLIFGTSIGGGNLNIINSAGGKIISTVETGSGTEAIARRPNSNEIWVGNNNEHNIKVIDINKMEIVSTFNCGIMPIRISFTDDGKYAIVSRYIIGDLAVYKADSKKLHKIINFGYYIADEKLYFDSHEEGKKEIVDKVVEDGARPLGTITDNQNKYLYVSLRGKNKIAVIDINTWQIKKLIDTGEGPDGLAIINNL